MITKKAIVVEGGNSGESDFFDSTIDIFDSNDFYAPVEATPQGITEQQATQIFERLLAQMKLYVVESELSGQQDFSRMVQQRSRF